MKSNTLSKRFVNCVDPRQHGEALTGNLTGIWRYRVGDYRLFAEIQDDVLIIEMIRIGYRKKFINNIHITKKTTTRPYSYNNIATKSRENPAFVC